MKALDVYEELDFGVEFLCSIRDFTFSSSLSANRIPTLSADPNNGPKVKVIAEIAAPIEKKAITAAKIFPAAVPGIAAGPSAVARSAMK